MSSLRIQVLVQSDLDSLVELRPTGWPDISPAFNFYVTSYFCFPIKVVQDNKIIGVGAAVIHEDIAWLAHIIVNENYRNKGIGQFITQSLVESSKDKNCQTIYLIATELGAIVYEKIGFLTETEYLFYKDIRIDQSVLIAQHTIPYRDDFFDQAIQIDRQISGEDRITNIKDHLSGGFVYYKDNIVEGFYLPNFGEGLILANTPLAGIELMKLRLSFKSEAAFPEENDSAKSFLNLHGFSPHRKAKRMRLGIKRKVVFESMYNRIGGNIG